MLENECAPGMWLHETTANVNRPSEVRGRPAAPDSRDAQRSSVNGCGTPSRPSDHV